MRKSPQKEAAERRAAERHEQAVSNAQQHLFTLRTTLRSTALTGEEGAKSKAVLRAEIERLIREDDIYMEAASEQYIALLFESSPVWKVHPLD